MLCLICASVEKGSRRGGATGSQCESDALAVSLGVFHRCCVATSRPPYTLYTFPTPSTPSTPSLHPPYTFPTPSIPSLHPLHPPFILPSTYLQQYFKIRSQAIEQLKRTGPSPYPHKFVVDISLSEFQTRFEDVPTGERREDVVVSVAGGWGLVGAGGVD